jgi:HK97 family phage portal protein
MGLLSRSLGVQAMTLEDPAQPLLPQSALFESLGLGRSDAGVLINEKQAMRITTALACIKIISEDLGTTSHEILQHMPDGSVRLATNHRLWAILHDQPNRHMTASVFWGALLASMLAWGNGYAWIKRDRAARVIELVPLESGKTASVRLPTGELKYATTQTDTGAAVHLDPEDVLHIMYASFDGVNGLSPIQLCKNAFGLALAAEKFGAQFFGNGARATGILTHPGVLEEEAQENIKKSLRELMTGDQALRPIVLEEGMKWQQITIPPNEAQFLTTRQFQRVEIASLYRMAMHLLQDLQRATNNNIEHQSLDHVRYCLRPNAVRIEQEVNRKLLDGPFIMEHNLNDLQRGDFASQTSGFQTLRNIGVYSANDILKAMRQNPIPSEEGGDVRTVQGAMIPLTALLLEEASPETSETDSDEGASQPFNRLAPAYRKLFRDAVGRVIRREPDKRAHACTVAMRPVISSMAQAMLALRFGNCELTRRELAVIDGQIRELTTAAASWASKDASAIATRTTEQTYRALAAEILE